MNRIQFPSDSIQICTIDVSTNEVIRFNEGKTNRAIVVYSGIHYDAIVLSPAGSRTNDPSKDKRIFSSSDDEELEGALELCRELKKRKYFTDTKNFSLKCNICKTGLRGEKAAVAHAKSTGHNDFGEYQSGVLVLFHQRGERDKYQVLCIFLFLCLSDVERHRQID